MKEDNDGIKVPDFDIEDIEAIVNLGVKEKVSFFKYLKNMISQLGLKNLFHDKNELIFIVLISITTMVFSLMNFIEEPNIARVYGFIFVSSPVVYLATTLFSFFNAKEKGAFEIELTCKYNLYQLSALRMFIFSVFTSVINTIIIVIMFMANKNVNLIRAICISITGLFLFSTIFLYVLVTIKKEVYRYATVVGWILINVMLCSNNHKAYSKALMDLPIYIHILITVICLVLYIKNLKKLIKFKSEKGES